ncbi:MAG: ribonuclease E/G [Pseudomonadota bacterium]
MSPRLLVLDRAPGVAPGLEVAALMAGGALEALDLQPRAADDAPQPGEIWAARIDRLLPAQGAAFLSLGPARAYLPEADGAPPGARLRVEITRAPEGTKAARARRRLEFSGPLLSHTPQAPGLNLSRKIADPARRAALSALLERLAAEAAGAPDAPEGWDPRALVLRSAAGDAPDDAIAAEARAHWAAARAALSAPLDPPRRLRAAPGLAARAEAAWAPDRVLRAAPDAPAGAALEACGALAAIAALRAKRVALKAGALTLERTEGMIAIDVDSGAPQGAGLDAVNLAAAAEIPRQLRLRLWGGPVLIDFAGGAPAEPAARARLERRLRAAADPDFSLAGWGPLGLCEARRRRRGPPLETLWPPAPEA